MAPLGRKFEEAVFAFVRTLDPAAEVLFDHDVLDRDTGKYRQCDVWINARFGGHWPFSILVSCKDSAKSGRKLHVGDIETFCGEVRSTGTSMGVIYSNTGFSTQAIEKARANQIVCCRLYQDEPADLPSVIWFDQFACHAGVRLTPKTDAVATATTTWNDLFDIEIEQGDKRETLLDVIASVFAEGEDEAIRKIGGAIVFPSDWGTEIALGDSAGNELRVQVWGRWTWYRARSEATLLDGSYCLSDGSFKGSQSGPMISLRDKHPGPSWVEVTDRDLVPPANRITAIRCSGDVRTALRQSYGPQLVRAQESSCS